MGPFHRDVLEEDMPYYSHKLAASSTVSTPELMVRHHSGPDSNFELGTSVCLLLRQWSI